MSGLEIALHYLEKVDNELERRIEALEESNERKMDAIHFVSKALEEVKHESVSYEARLKDYHEMLEKKPSSSRRAEHKETGAKATTPTRIEDEKLERTSNKKGDEKPGGDDGEGGVRSSLDDILAKARDLRKAKVNQLPQPPFGSRQGARASSSLGGKQDHHQQRGKMGSSVSSTSAPKKAASKTTATSRRPLHESKFTTRRRSSDGSGAKAVSSSSRGSSDRLSAAKEGGVSAPRKVSKAASPAIHGATPSRSPMDRPPSPILSPSRRSEEKEDTAHMATEAPPPPPEFNFGPYSTYILNQGGPRPPLKPSERILYYDEADINEKAVLVEASKPRPEDFVAKAREFSEIMGRPTLPPSVVLSALRDLPEQRRREEARLMKGGEGEGYGARGDGDGGGKDVGDDDDEVDEDDAADDRDNWREGLPVALEERARAVEILKEAGEEYERKWSLKLGRMKEHGGPGSGDRSVGLAQLPMHEREALVTLWYRIRRCFEIYGEIQDRVDHLLLCMARDTNLETPSGSVPHEPRAVAVLREMARRDAEQNPPRSWEQRLFEDLVEDLPDRTPFPSPLLSPHSASAGGGPVPAAAARSNRVSARFAKLRKLPSEDQALLREKLAHVGAFHDDVKSRVTYVAEAIIGRHVLKDLVKEMKFCYENDVPRSQWVEALKKYKMLHTMLVEQGQVGNSIKFFGKKEA